ncbi:hypothetical protein [Streptomyces sp. NRRL S-378]|uniref:hypothetical protein n=1 Tax=Streptomyces sp. NRRL S-378 TaxID=1463904 RepID=UPI00069210C8|nr:hypothetical protein [Streptomyces sp. NRRL S-378]
MLRELIAARVHLRETFTVLRALAAAGSPGASLPQAVVRVVEEALAAVVRADATCAVMWERRSRS